MSDSTKKKSKWWNLSKYSRFRPKENLKVPGAGIFNPGNSQDTDWVTEEAAANVQLRLRLTADGHLFITKDKQVLQSMFIPFASTDSTPTKIFCNKDSLAFLRGLSQESCMFRVQFAKSKQLSAEEVCQNCSEALKSYFSMSSSDVGIQNQNNPAALDVASQSNRRDGEFTSLSVLTSKLLKNDVESLPLVYRELQETGRPKPEKNESMEQFISMCIADPQFPAYVKQVETILKKLVTEEAK